MILGFVNLKGGVGKSTLCINVAGILASQGRKVLILDMDTQGSSLKWYERRRKRPVKLSLPLVVRPLRNFPTQAELRNLTRNLDVVLLDGAANDEIVSSAALNLADLIILPMKPSPIDFDGTMDTVKFIERRPGKRIRRTPPWYVVLNLVRTGTNIASEYANEILPETWPHNVISNQVVERVVYQSSMKDGLTVSEAEPDGPATSDMKKVTMAILRRVNH